MKKLTVSLLLCCTLCGCYKPADINSLGYLLAVGIDNGADNNYIYTLQFANPIAFAGKESGTEGAAVKSVTVEASSLNKAFIIASGEILKEIDTAYLKLIVFSKKVNIKDTVSMMLKTSQFHPDAYVAFSECTAAEFLDDINSPLEINPAKYYNNIFENLYNEYAPPVTLKYAGGEYCMFPVVDKGSNSSGVVVTKNGTIVIESNKTDGKIFNVMSGNMNAFDYEVKNPHSVLKLYSGSNPDIKLYLDNNPNIEINLILTGDIIENIHSNNNNDIIKSAENQLKTEISTFLNYYYNENNLDIFGFLELFKKKFLINSAFEQFNRQTRANDIVFDVNVDISIKRDGIMLK